MKEYVYDVVIIGGGAAGLFAAAELPSNLKTVILEAGERVGKKLLATGNGKCNLTNLDMNIAHYNKPSYIESFLDRFDAHDTVASFEKLGLLTKVVDKRVYPYSECASTVLDILRRAVERNNIHVLCSHIVKSVESFSGDLIVEGVYTSEGVGSSENESENFKAVKAGQQKKSFRIKAQCVLLATGSPATFGRDSNSLYTALGHTNKEFTPSLVPIVTDKEPLKGLQGVRVKAGVRIGYRYEVGEVLFKPFGLSGIAVFNLASEIARGRAKPGAVMSVDFMPESSQAEAEALLRKRGNVKVGDLLTGTFHTKVIERIMAAAKVNAEDDAQSKIGAIANAVKNYKITIEGLGDNSLAQVMSGGLDVGEFDDNLMSLKVKNAYAAGEALDIDGDSGGYNLQWAWTSAKIAATAIAKSFNG
jgi:predicted flavoprotein YhiN